MQMPSPRFWRQGLIWTGISLFLFLLITRPLGCNWTRGIPSSSQNLESPPARAEIAGDHMQLLYHFDLVHDMMRGRIPWLHNVWEFNTGDDAARFRPGGLFMPGSAVYALLRFVFPQAAAWNSTLFLSFALSLFTLWIWLGRFTPDPAPRILGLSLILLIPFRWASLLGGSPAGIGLMWVGLLALCIDSALRRPSLRNGFFTGLVILFLFHADLQTFYFSMVTLPAFGLMTLLHLDASAWKAWKTWLRLLPGLTFGAVSVLIFFFWRKRYLSGSLMKDGRDGPELALYSPRPSALWTPGHGIDETVFLGPAVAVGLLLALALTLFRLLRNRKAPELRQTLAFVIALGAVALGIALALGVHGPREATAIRLAREHVPMYRMIRQPSKIFAVVPFWIGWLLAVGFQPFATESRLLRRLRHGGILLLTLWIAGTYLRQVSATIALLPGDQPAYAAVAEDAGTDIPRALVVPLWPGDSAETSIPLFFAHRHGIRLVNGYSPVVQQTYMENIFRGLESVNMGHLEDAQIDFLLEMGVRHLLVHENQFPEKVSPFPIHETVWRLENHPRIERLALAGPVRALRLLPAPREVETRPRPFPAAFAARRWEFEHMSREGGEVLQEEGTGHGAFWRATADESTVLWAETRAARIPPGDDLVWWIRVRGQGRATLLTFRGGEETARQNLEVDWAPWHWQPIPVEAGPNFDPVTLRILPEQGEVDFDLIVLCAGDWPQEIPADGLEIPAVSFFRAGHPSDDERGIVFLAERDPSANLLYGPRLPFPTGQRLRLELLFDSPAPDGTPLGEFYVRIPEAEELRTPVISGQAAVLDWQPSVDLPAEIGFSFSRNADLHIRGVRIITD